MKFLFVPSCAALLLPAGLMLGRADDAGLPAGPFDVAHYRLLWETSPFAVASPVAVESEQFALVGAAQFEGISYASLVDKGSQEHFVITSKEPSHGMSLLSLVHGSTPGSTYATLQKSGGILRLNLDTASLPGAPPPPPAQLRDALPVNANPMPTSIIPSSHPRRMRPARTFQPPVYVPQPPPAGSNSP